MNTDVEAIAAEIRLHAQLGAAIAVITGLIARLDAGEESRSPALSGSYSAAASPQHTTNSAR